MLFHYPSYISTNIDNTNEVILNVIQTRVRGVHTNRNFFIKAIKKWPSPIAENKQIKLIRRYATKAMRLQNYVTKTYSDNLLRDLALKPLSAKPTGCGLYLVLVLKLI